MSIKDFFSKLLGKMNRVSGDKRLPLALTIAISLSVFLVIISVWLYSSGGYDRLDLSRPGFEHERKQVLQGETQQTYDTTSPVTKKAIDDFLKEYDGHSRDLNSYGNFRDQVLDDGNLQLQAKP